MGMQSTTEEQTNRAIVVIGATGNQGGAVLGQLRQQGFAAKALVRDPDSAGAQRLAAAGVPMVRGDLDDRASLDRTLDGAYGAFAVFTFARIGVEGELRQGTSFADAALAAGLQHVVYSSVSSADRHTGIPHFESKYQIEQHIRAIGLPATILRPTSLMENYLWARENILGGTFSQPLYPDTTFQMVSVDDIGAFAAIAFANPQQWMGRAIDLAGDEPTMPQAVEIFGRVIGRPVEYVQMSMEDARRAMGEEGYKMYSWFNEVGFAADIPSLRAIYPGLTSLEQWLRRTGWTSAAIQQAQPVA